MTGPIEVTESAAVIALSIKSWYAGSLKIGARAFAFAFAAVELG